MEFLSLHQVTPLHLAAEGARIKMLKSLVDQKADINVQDHNKVKCRLSVGMTNFSEWLRHTPILILYKFLQFFPL